MLKDKTLIYLGPKGSYTELAVKSIFFDDIWEKTKCEINNSIINVIKKTDENIDYIAVIPIENSIEGIVRETVDNLINIRDDLFITKEAVIPISHCLISKAKNISAINTIMSIEQALAQCSHYIASTFHNVQLVKTTSTSEAVRLLSEYPDNYAAIGNVRAAEIYGYNVIAQSINDVKENKTRFVKLDSSPAPRTGCDKTSIVFSASNTPGSLVDILLKFRENNLNMSYIESRPVKNVFGEYRFFVDIDGHITDEPVKSAIAQIMPLVSFYKFLGSYPRSKSN